MDWQVIEPIPTALEVNPPTRRGKSLLEGIRLTPTISPLGPCICDVTATQKQQSTHHSLRKRRQALPSESWVVGPQWPSIFNMFGALSISEEC